MKSSMVLGIALFLGLPVGQAQAQGDVESLRGAVPLEQESRAPAVKHWQPDRAPMARQYVQQPPLIPHSIDGYQVNLKFNKCLSCHSWANYQQARATKISQTHFQDRDGNALSDVSARRYFCTQCHVPQVEAKPLVENEFKPAGPLGMR